MQKQVHSHLEWVNNLKEGDEVSMIDSIETYILKSILGTQAFVENEFGHTKSCHISELYAPPSKKSRRMNSTIHFSIGASYEGSYPPIESLREDVRNVITSYGCTIDGDSITISTTDYED